MQVSTRSFLAVSLLAAAFTFAAPAMAQTKIGVVDFTQVFGASPQYKAMEEASNSEFGPRAQQLNSAKQAFKARAEKLQKDSATMTADQKTKAERELRETARDLERKETDLEQEANEWRRNEMRKIEGTLLGEVQEFAKAQNFDIVIAKSAVLYSANAIDITPAVLQALSARAPKPAAAPAKPPAKP
ncbi:MAG TPA: OmpH family outer membrane protein [Steroidobacteraceae bacterium]